MGVCPILGFPPLMEGNVDMNCGDLIFYFFIENGLNSFSIMHLNES